MFLTSTSHVLHTMCVVLCKLVLSLTMLLVLGTNIPILQMRKIENHRLCVTLPRLGKRCVAGLVSKEGIRLPDLTHTEHPGLASAIHVRRTANPQPLQCVWAVLRDLLVQFKFAYLINIENSLNLHIALRGRYHYYPILQMKKKSELQRD